MFRVRLLKDGRDFASGHLTMVQEGPRALLVLTIERGGGDWHPTLDRPVDGAVEISDLLHRFEVIHPAATVEPADTGRAYRIAAGTNSVTVSLSRASFDGHAVAVESGAGDGRAWVDAVLYSGAAKTFHFADGESGEVSGD